jgi:hypothetical protein
MHNDFLVKSKEEVIKQIFKTVVPNVSWNYAKILAVNGRTLMTGRANFWDEYGDNEVEISDLYVKIRDDAAVSAHKYCDYFWR